MITLETYQLTQVPCANWYYEFKSIGSEFIDYCVQMLLLWKSHALHGSFHG